MSRGVAQLRLGDARRPAVLSRRADVEKDVKRLVARELHDRVAQTLTGMLIDVENFKIEPVEWNDVLRQLDTIQESTREVLTNLRQLLHDLRGEEAASDHFVESVRVLVARFEEQTRISTQLQVMPGWPESLSRPASVNLYRIIEEALTNVRMHSGAGAVRVSLQAESDHQVSVQIVDDGKGFDTSEFRQLGMGTIGMRERALMLGGQLRVESRTVDGTVVRAVFPMELLTPDDSHKSRMRTEPKEISV